MPSFHVLDKAADAEFLRAGVADPLTRVAFRPTNRVARCAVCGLVSLRETWEAVGGCPNGHTEAAAWDPRAALVALGDGAAGASPVAAAPFAPDPYVPGPARRPAWLVPAVLVALAALVAVLFAAGVFSGDEAAPAPVVVDATPEPTGPRAVAVEAGETEGRLDEGDFRGSDGRYQDLYTFAADSSGRLLTVTLVTSAFAPELTVETPSGERVRAEPLPAAPAADGSATSERRVTVRDLRGPGLYRITVTTREPDAAGAYTLRVRQDEAVRTLTPGAATTQADLGTQSLRRDGFYLDTYRFTGAAGREHTLRVGSSDFAPTVTVSGPSGPVRGETGRAGGSVTFTFTPTAAGTYSAVVSSRERDRTGRYTVGLTVEAPPREETTATPPAAGGGSLRDGASLRDSLGLGQTRSYTVSGQIGDRVTVQVDAEGFTPSLVLVGPTGVLQRAAPDGGRARLRSVVLPSTGRYRVEISGSGAGRFSVSLDQEAAPTSDRIPRLPGQDAPIRSQIEPSVPPPDEDAYRPQPIEP